MNAKTDFILRKTKLRRDHAELIECYFDRQRFPTIKSLARHLDINLEACKARIRYLRSYDLLPESRKHIVSMEEHFFNDNEPALDVSQTDRTATEKEIAQEKEERVAEEAERLLSANKDALIRQLLKERARTKIVADSCVEAIMDLNIQPVSVPTTRHEQSSTASMHLMFSDVQVGQFADPSWMPIGVGYCYEKFCERLERLGDKLIMFYDMYSHSMNINKLVINMLGDVVEGEGIFRGQAYQLDRVVVDQLFDGHARIIEFILRLAQVFPSIEIFTVYGNHGRVGKKGEHPDRVNWDYVFYRVLSMSAKQQSNVNVFVSQGPHMVVQHGDFNFFLNHGDKVKSWMGIPFYGLDRMCQKLPGLTRRIVDYVLVGHFHRHAKIETPTGMLLVNGNFVGGSYFSTTTMFETSHPSQTMYLFHDRHGIHSVSDLILDKTPELVQDSNGIYTAIHKE